MQCCSAAVLKVTCVERNVADVVGTSAVGAQVGNVDGWKKKESFKWKVHPMKDCFDLKVNWGLIVGWWSF